MTTDAPDEVPPDATLERLDIVIGSSSEFSALFQADMPEGGVCFGKRTNLAPGRSVSVTVRLGRRLPPMQLEGKVVWSRPGRILEKLRAGLGIEFLPTEAHKVQYLLELARSGEAKSRRRHE